MLVNVQVLRCSVHKNIEEEPVKKDCNNTGKEETKLRGGGRCLQRTNIIINPRVGCKGKTAKENITSSFCQISLSTVLK